MAASHVCFRALKIGFLINTSEPYYRGGYERRTWSLARELARQGHEVRVYTSGPARETIDGVHFFPVAAPRAYFNSSGVRNGWADLLFVAGMLPLAWRWASHELDVLDICATPFLHLPLARWLCRSKKIPAILTCHEALLVSLPGYVVERGHRHALAARFMTRVLAWLYRHGMSRFPERIAVSHRTAAALKEEGFPARHVLEFGLEPEAFAPQPPQAGPVSAPRRFIFCGRLTPIKAVDLAIRALLALRGKTTNTFLFDIIGEGSEREKWEALVDQAQAAAIVTFHGEVDEQRKRTLLAQSEVFLLSSRREGFSIATLEAMAQGNTAIVVSDSACPSGVLDFVVHGVTGLVAEPSEAGMAECVRSLIDDAATTLRLRQAAWRRAQDYQIARQAARAAAIYASIHDSAFVTEKS